MTFILNIAVINIEENLVSFELLKLINYGN